MKRYGIIGKSLSHSYSQQYFTKKIQKNNILNAEYALIPIDNITEVKEILNNPTFFGFNVTNPFKKVIIPFLDDITVAAQEIGAVNCVIKNENRWIGHNTDVVGFEQTMQKVESLLRSTSKNKKHKALILGTGGASKAVGYVLMQKNIPFQLISRTKTENTLTYSEISHFIINHHTLIINTTPLGMFPNVKQMPPIPYSALNGKHILIDLIYNPAETLFLKEGKKRGAPTINGMEMFTAQAEKSWELFNIE